MHSCTAAPQGHIFWSIMLFLNHITDGSNNKKYKYIHITYIYMERLIFYFFIASFMCSVKKEKLKVDI